jgi:hypothetical protein
MTWIHVSTSSRPRAATAARARRSSCRTMLLALPVALLLMGAFATPGVAATKSTTESGYNQKPPVPKSEAKPSSETAPAKEAEPAQSTAPSSTTSPSSSSALPFTGLDLRWVLGGGLLLIGAGISIRVIQRRERQGTGR